MHAYKQTSKTTKMYQSASHSFSGTPSASTAGKNCTTDYVIIPGGTDDTGVGCDRYCGIGFPNAVICKSRI